MATKSKDKKRRGQERRKDKTKLGSKSRRKEEQTHNSSSPKMMTKAKEVKQEERCWGFMTVTLRNLVQVLKARLWRLAKGIILRIRCIWEVPCYRVIWGRNCEKVEGKILEKTWESASKVQGLERSFLGMVGTRMESRVENVENELGVVKEDLSQVKEVMLMMKDTLERLEKKVDKGEKDSEEVNDKAKDREEVNDGDSNKCRKLELHLFDGDDAVGWLFRVERYFSINRMKDEEKLEAVAFKMELLRRFHQSQLGNGYEMLMALKQTGTVAEYREKFELLSAPLKDAPEDKLIGPKWNPIKPSFSTSFNIVSESAKAAVSNNESSSNSRKIESKDGEAKSANSSTSTNKSKYWRLTDEEIAKKRRLEDAEELGIEDDGQREGKQSGTLMFLSMNSIVGITGGRTMKLLGTIKGKKVLVMIDSGASHNFISSSLVAQLTLLKEDTSVYEVTVGDGHVVKGQGICKGLQVEMQGAHVKQNFYLFNLGEIDVILGIEWLESLGEVSVNWRQLTMKYKEGENEISLKGDASLARTKVAFKTVMKSVRKGGQGYLIELGRMETQSDEEEKVDEKIQQILNGFSEVCNPLQGLQPSRNRVHAILIKEGSQPPNI
ncbi:putative mitochondrial protein [Senna tora]|uniref:Putative mitochondrial protein n=1 Tax=Senna tora TaxID=362788 RepID=A0A834SFG1_9FABA|nr:putative mitochondrial protein [Senna tora]